MTTETETEAFLRRVKNQKASADCAPACGQPSNDIQTPSDSPVRVQPVVGPTRCEACHKPPHKWNSMRVLGCGGDYEDWPCRLCQPEAFKKTLREAYL